jgi:integrase/recombinase XerD
MLEELQRRNYSPETFRGYIQAAKQFADYFDKSPDELGAEEVRRFQLYLLKEKRLEPSTVKIRITALRFLYKKTLRRRDLDIDDLPFPKVPKKLPAVLSHDEVTRLIEAASNPTYRTILMVLYGTGMRRAEVPRLKMGDIDSERMIIHVRQGKGGRDRDVLMSPKLLEALRAYYRRKRPKTYIFSSTADLLGVDHPISDKGVWHAVHGAAKRAGLSKIIGPHTRHTFATRLCEAGADLRTIQLLLGHASLRHTVIYLHLSQRHLGAVTNPLDQITLRSHSEMHYPPEDNH